MLIDSRQSQLFRYDVVFVFKWEDAFAFSNIFTAIVFYEDCVHDLYQQLFVDGTRSGGVVQTA